MCPYDGPFKVLSRRAKYFVFDIKSKEQNISIDHLKPAYVELPTGGSDLPIPSSTPMTTTRSGRIIKKPVHFGNNIEA